MERVTDSCRTVFEDVGTYMYAIWTEGLGRINGIIALKSSDREMFWSVRFESDRGRLAPGGKEKDLVENVDRKKLLNRLAFSYSDEASLESRTFVEGGNFAWRKI